MTEKTKITETITETVAESTQITTTVTDKTEEVTSEKTSIIISELCELKKKPISGLLRLVFQISIQMRRKVFSRKTGSADGLHQNQSKMKKKRIHIRE